MAERVTSWRHVTGGARRLVGVAIGFLGVSVIGVVLLLWQLYAQALSDAVLSVETLRTAAAEQTVRAIQAVDMVLEAMQKQAADAGMNTVDAVRAGFGTAAVHATLVGQTGALPQLEALAVVDAGGSLVNTSREWPVTAMNLADRDYFTTLQAGGLEAFISAPVPSRLTGKPTFYLGRRLNGPRGEFLGLVLAALRIEYFGDFYAALTAGLEVTVRMRRLDGTLLTRTAPRSGAAADGRMIGSGRTVLEGYPLAMSVTISERAALTQWRRTALLAGIFTLCAVVCMGALLAALLLQLRRLDQSESSLEERNLVLEETRQGMERQAAALQSSQAELAGQSRALETTLAHMNQGIIMVAADHRVMVHNQRAAEMLELPAALLASRPRFEELAAWQRAAGEFTHPDNQPSYQIGRGAVLTERQVYERTRPNGRVIEFQTVPLAGGGMVRTYTDVTARRQAEARIRHASLHDSLTGLGNRVVLREQLDQAVLRADRGGTRAALLYMDLDGFKLVNDTCGHALGDKLLVEVAGRLTRAMLACGTVARMGGDEFAAIQSPVADAAEVERLAEQVQAAIREPYLVDEVMCLVNVSIGIALYPDHAAGADELLRNADVALYRAKGEGKGTCRMFDAVMDQRQRHLFRLEQDLRHALTDGQLMVAYQPILDVATRQTVRYEALLRWRHAELGMVGPGDFVPLAEKSGLIVPIGLWVLETACREAAGWLETVEVSVNVSPVQFLRGDLPVAVAEVLARTGLAASRLHLEVTEGMLLDDTPVVREAMARLQSMGVQFSLDDFGTAHAGLTYLRRFSFNELKIDKSFVQEAADRPESRAIVEAIMAIGVAFGMVVVAEGVETEGQMAMVQALGCQQVQGYLLGRPGPPPRPVAALVSTLDN